MSSWADYYRQAGRDWNPAPPGVKNVLIPPVVCRGEPRRRGRLTRPQTPKKKAPDADPEPTLNPSHSDPGNHTIPGA